MNELNKTNIEAKIEMLRELQKSEDEETAHYEADYILCDVLAGLGFSELVEAWEKIDKWYA